MTYEEFKTKFNITLNEQQEAAVQRVDGATLLLAVPGSGKTTVLVTRLGYMIYCRSISASQILTMTYSVASTKDMRNRFSSIFEYQNSEKLKFLTINSLCVQVINYYVRSNNTKAFELVKDTSSLINELFRRATNDYPSEGDIKNLQSLITYAKNMQLTENEIDKLTTDSIPFAQIYHEYITEMRSRGLMDFDDQLIYAHSILLRNKSILSHFQNTYKYICVDEAQDTSKIQHKIIELLTGPNNNIFMVGDEDQSIYGFRGAFPEALMSFQNSFARAKVLLLEKNYRSTKSIVEAASRFIKQNNLRHEKDMLTDNEKGKQIQQISMRFRSAQYKYLLRMLQDNEQETAILFRNNESAIPLIDLLDRNGIGYRCRQQDSTFFSHHIVRDIEEFIEYAYNSYDAERFMHLYYKVNCSISKMMATEVVQNVTQRANGSFFLDLAANENIPENTKDRAHAFHNELIELRNDTPINALKRIRYKMGYGAYLKQRNADFEKFNILLLIGSEETELQCFLKRLQSLHKIVQQGTTDGQSNVILSTVHSSKGLEYNRVIFIDVIDGILPSVSMDSGKALNKEEIKTLEEERRLFYVGVTRAKDELILFKYDDYADKSTFVRQLCYLPTSLSKNVKVKKEVSYKLSGKTHLSMKDYIPKTRVKHNTFGYGVVLKVNDGIIEIQFDNSQIKKFGLASCLENGFLSLL